MVPLQALEVFGSPPLFQEPSVTLCMGDSKIAAGLNPDTKSVHG